jgi:signal transduction histidine kinase
VSGSRVYVGIMAVLCTVYLIAALRVDDLGFVYDGRYVTEVDPGGAADRAGMRAGDVVVVDPLSTGDLHDDRAVLTWARRNSRLMKAGALRFEVQRDQKLVVVTVIPAGPTLAASIRQLSDAIASVPIALTFFAVAFLFARRARRDHPARARIAVGLALCGSYFAYWGVFPYSAWMQILWSLAPAGSIIGYMLVAQGVWALGPRTRARGALQLTTAVVGIAVAVVEVLHIHAVIPQLPLNNLLQWIGHAAMFVSILAGLFVVWRTSDEPATRRSARLTFMLVAIGLLLPLMTVAGPYVFAGISVAGIRQAVWQLYAVVPIALAATAARTGLLELEGRSPAVVLVAVSFGCALLIYVGLKEVVDASLSGAVAVDAGRMVSFAIVVAIAEPLRSMLRRGLDRLFARDRAELISRCSQLCAELARIGDVHAIELATRNVLHAHTARLCALAELVDEHQDDISQRLAARGALRVSEIEDERVRRALAAVHIDTLVDVLDGSMLLALAVPLAPVTWDRAVRQALASVGKVIASQMQERVVRRALESRIARDAAERRGIAMELHDGLGATLTAARLLTQMVRRAEPSAPPANTLEGLEATLQTGLHDLRVALWGLDEHTTWGELVAKLRRQVAEMCGLAGLSLELTSDLTDGDSGGPAVHLAIYRIVQEAVTNTVKHAHATRIVCSLRVVNEGIQLVFQDDGVGMPTTVSTGRGLGNMRRRVAALAGTIRFTQGDERGTRIEVWLPSHPHEHARDGDVVIPHHG